MKIEGKTLYHIEFLKDISQSEKHKYYTNLKKLCQDNNDLGVGYWTLTRLKDKDFPYTHKETFTIHKGTLIASKFKKVA